MFLHLLIGDLQITPAVARHLGNHYKALQCFKLEIIHENQLIEYGLISKDTKIETLFPFQQTIHIPLDNYFHPIDGLNEDENNNSNLQKLSFTIFAIVGRDHLIRLGSGVMTSTVSKGESKIVAKTVIFRSDQFELIAKLSVNTAYHESLLDITDLLQLKNNTSTITSVKQQQLQQSQEYAFLLSRKFRRSEAEFPSTFDYQLDRKLKEDTEYYIENIRKRNQSPPQQTAGVRSNGKGKLHSGGGGGGGRKPSPVSKIAATEKERVTRRSFTASSQKRVPTRSSSAGRAKGKVEKELPVHRVDSPKLRKTAMSVGYVHNSWPNPLEHEREKKKFQLRMADEKKQLLLQQIKQEIDLQKQRAIFVHKQQRQHQQEVSQEKSRKKQLTKELKNREVEIRRLQDELHNIRLQAILSAQKAHPTPSTPATNGRYASPHSGGSRGAHRGASSSEKKTATSDEKQKSKSSLEAKKSAKTSSYDQRINQLINSQFSNFFKQVTPIPNSKKRKDSPAARKRDSFDAAVAKSRSSPNVQSRSEHKTVKGNTAVSPISVEEHGNDVIKVSVIRAATPKARNQVSSPVGRYQKPVDVSDKKQSPDFEFHDIYRKSPDYSDFNSDKDFTVLNQELRRTSHKSTQKATSSSKKAKASSTTTSRHKDLEDTHLLDDNEDEALVFERSMEDEIAAINRAIHSHSDDEDLSESNYQAVDKNSRNFISRINNTNATINESIRSDSTSDVYAVPGFLQSLVHQQPQTETAAAHVQTHPPSYYADIDVEEDDEDGDDMSDSDFERKFHLLASGEEEEDDDNGKQIEKSWKIETDYLTDRLKQSSSSNKFILPSKDLDYPDHSYSTNAYDENQLQDTDDYPSTAFEKTVAATRAENIDDKSEEDVSPRTDYQRSRTQRREPQTASTLKRDVAIEGNDDNLDFQQRYEFEYRYSSPSITKQQYASSANATLSKSASRSRSREKILQQFEKNRQYSSSSTSAISTQITETTQSYLTNTITTTATNTITSTASAANIEDLTKLKQTDEDEEQYSQLDSLLEKAKQAITDAVKNVVGEQTTINSGKIPQVDASWSDDDTIENNIMDTISFHGKFMQSFSDDTDEEKESNKKVSSVYDSETLNALERNRFDESKENPVTEVHFADEEENMKGKEIVYDSDSDESETFKHTISTSSGESDLLQQKLDRISVRINSLLSDSGADVKSLVKGKETVEGPVLIQKAPVPLVPKTVVSEPPLPASIAPTPPIDVSPLESKSTSEKRSVSFANKIEEVREIQAAETNNYLRNFTLEAKEHQKGFVIPEIPNEIDYTKPGVNRSTSHRSIIEKQFEKNRKYAGSISSPAAPFEGGRTETASVTADLTPVVSADTVVKAEPRSAVQEAAIKMIDLLPIAESSLNGNSKAEVQIGSNSVQSLVSSSKTEAVSERDDKASTERDASEEKNGTSKDSKVKSIISQFEKNRRYNASSTVMKVESISHPSMKIASPKSLKSSSTDSLHTNEIKPDSTISPKRSFVFPSFTESGKSATTPQSTTKKTEEEVSPGSNTGVLSYVKRKDDPNSEWNAIEAALDSLEIRVKTSEILGRHGIIPTSIAPSFDRIHNTEEANNTASLSLQKSISFDTKNGSILDENELSQDIQDSLNQSNDQTDLHANRSSADILPSTSKLARSPRDRAEIKWDEKSIEEEAEVIHQRRLSTKLLLQQSVVPINFSDTEEEEEESTDNIKAVLDDDSEGKEEKNSEDEEIDDEDDDDDGSSDRELLRKFMKDMGSDSEEDP